MRYEGGYAMQQVYGSDGERNMFQARITDRVLDCQTIYVTAYNQLLTEELTTVVCDYLNKKDRCMNRGE